MVPATTSGANANAVSAPSGVAPTTTGNSSVGYSADTLTIGSDHLGGVAGSAPTAHGGSGETVKADHPASAHITPVTFPPCAPLSSPMPSPPPTGSTALPRALRIAQNLINAGHPARPATHASHPARPTTHAGHPASPTTHASQPASPTTHARPATHASPPASALDITEAYPGAAPVDICATVTALIHVSVLPAAAPTNTCNHQPTPSPAAVPTNTYTHPTSEGGAAGNNSAPAIIPTGNTTGHAIHTTNATARHPTTHTTSPAVHATPAATHAAPAHNPKGEAFTSTTGSFDAISTNTIEMVVLVPTTVVDSACQPLTGPLTSMATASASAGPLTSAATDDEATVHEEVKPIEARWWMKLLPSCMHPAVTVG